MVNLKELARLDAARAPPAWLAPLLETKFFEPCPEHPAIRSTRNYGCNFFCTDCAGAHALCSGCLAADHVGHQIIQIRKSSSHCVVKVAEIQHLLSVSQVQTYLINGGEPLVFLDKRAISGEGKRGGTRCEECNMGLQDADCLFCSLGCKAKVIEDRLDFDMSFAVDPKSDSSGEDSSSESDDDDLSRPTKFRELRNVSGSRQVAARSGHRTGRSR